MSHKHPIYDSDPHFTIDPITRKIVNQTAGKTKLMQYDHNSERFTFDIPRLVDGHDMSLCDKVEIHYINISTNGGQQNADVYPVDDIAINEETDEVYFSWLVSQNATQIVGFLNFIVKFVCLDGDEIIYSWSTDISRDITISDGINNGESVVAEFSDVLEAWKAEVVADSKAEILASVDSEIEAKTAEAFDKIEEKASEAVTAAAGKIDKYSNALKGTASGEAIAITDASPIEHEMGIKIRSKNILPYPYSRSDSHTANGITFTPNEDRSITISGVATGNVYYVIWNANLGSRNMVGSASGGTNGDYAFSPFVNYSASNKNVSLYVANGTDLSTPVTVYPQIEKGTTATAYAPYIEDISTVKVKKYGKNLFKATTEQKVLKGITAEKQADGTYHVYGTSDGTGDFWMDMEVVLPKGIYTGSGSPAGASSTTHFIEYHNRTTGKGKVDYGTGATFETAETNTIIVHMAVKSGQTVDLIYKPMIEVSSTATAYEPYIEPVEYPVSADGTVNGITPNQPTTTLITDTAGAVIDCTYNRDINKAFEELYNAIISTGGNV